MPNNPGSEWVAIKEDKLWGGSFHSRRTSLCAMIFGELIQLAAPKLESFHGDLFHDATWLNENLTGPMNIAWALRDSGTHIGDESYVDAVKKAFGDGDLEAYLITVQDRSDNGSGAWVITFYKRETVIVKPGEALKVSYLQADGSYAYDPATISVIGDSESFSPYEPNVPDTIPLPAGLVSHYGLPTDDNRPYSRLSDGTVIPIPVFNEYSAEEKAEMFQSIFPTPVNTPINKERGTMDSILRELRSKSDEASSVRDEIEEHVGDLDTKMSELNDAKDELDNYIDELQSLIDSLESLPEVSVYVDSIDIDTVSFDS